MIRHRTGSIGSTRTLGAGMNTFVIAAGFRGTAVVIGVAAKDTLVVQADMAQEAVVVDTTGNWKRGYETSN